MRYRSTWRPAPPTAGQVLPWLLILAIALGAICYRLPYILWGAP